MVGLPYDCLANPLGAVRFTFDKAVASGFDPTISGSKDWGATDLFREFLFDQDGLSQVPMLNPTTIKRIQPNTLVRFRGMIQDRLENEFYVGAYKHEDVWRTNKFADVSQFPMESSKDGCMWERQLLYCVSVPGQNSWTESTSEAVISPVTSYISPQGEKRQREDDTSMDDDVDMQVSGHHTQLSCVKRRREGDVPVRPSNTQDAGTREAFSDSPIARDLERTSFPCIVKMYDSPESDLKLNDVFEFICVLTFDTDFADVNGDEMDAVFCEAETSNLALTKEVPRIHCLVHRRLSAQDFLSSPLTLEVEPYMVKGIREALLGHLTAILGNDQLAAQFMLLHLLSRVHTRIDAGPIGKLSLNLTCFGAESISVFGNCLNQTIKNLVPFTHFVSLTLDYLNSASLAPRKDYHANRLVTGVLQIPHGSHLTIDETQLQAGTLNSNGVNNARILKALVESQQVEYEFTFYKIEMAVDIQLLILSEGKSSIVPADLVLPFCPTSVDFPGIVDPTALEAWRWYLAAMRSLPHSIGLDVQKVVENDLVAARQADRSIGNNEFNRLLTMGRLVSASFGETSLSLDHWQTVKDLEKLRKERLQQG